MLHCFVGSAGCNLFTSMRLWVTEGCRKLPKSIFPPSLQKLKERQTNWFLFARLKIQERVLIAQLHGDVSMVF
jgi:hypothetical protein